MNRSHGVKTAWAVGGIIGLIGIASYVVIIDPMINPEKYSKYEIFVWKKEVKNTLSLDIIAF